MIKRRFIQLAKTIEAAGRFDLGSFVAFIDYDNITHPDYEDPDDILRFNPAKIVNNCNTTGCVAGWVNAIIKNNDATDTEAAREWLGLSMEDANQLFHNFGRLWRGFDTTDAEDAGRLLRALAAGEILFKECDPKTYQYTERSRG